MTLCVWPFIFPAFTVCECLYSALIVYDFDSSLPSPSFFKERKAPLERREKGEVTAPSVFGGIWGQATHIHTHTFF